MNDPHVADPKLTEAFRAWSESSEAECSDEMRHLIWQAVSGELPPAERQQVVEMTATDPACAQAWRIAAELWRASGATDGAALPGDAASAPKTRFFTRAWLAAAAVLLLTTTIGVTWLLNRPPTDVYRAAGGYAVQSLVSPEASLPRNAFRLRWNPGPVGSRYDIRVTTEDLHVLTAVSELATPELVVPEERFEGVIPGARILWQVEASLPDGDRVTSQTFVTRMQ